MTSPGRTAAKGGGGGDVIVAPPDSYFRPHVGDFLPKISKVELDFGGGGGGQSSLLLRHRRLLRHREQQQRHQAAASLPTLPAATNHRNGNGGDVTILKLNLQRHHLDDDGDGKLMTSSTKRDDLGALQVGDLMQTYPPPLSTSGAIAVDDVIVNEYDVIKRDFLRRRVEDGGGGHLPPPPVSSPVVLGDCGAERRFLAATECGVFHEFDADGRHQVVRIDEIVPTQPPEVEAEVAAEAPKNLANPSSNFKIFIATKRRNQQQQQQKTGAVASLLRHADVTKDRSTGRRGGNPEIGNLLVKSYANPAEGSPPDAGATVTAEASCKPVDQSARGTDDVIVSTFEPTSQQRRRKKFDDERRMARRKFKVKNFAFPLVTSFDQICHGIRHQRQQQQRDDVTSADDVTTNESLEKFKIETANCASLSSTEANCQTTSSAPPTSHPLYDEMYTKRKMKPHNIRLKVRKEKNESLQQAEHQENQKRQIPIYSLSMLRVNEDISHRHNRPRTHHHHQQQQQQQQQQSVNGIRFSNFLPPRPMWSTTNTAGGAREQSSWDPKQTFHIHGDSSFHHAQNKQNSNDVIMGETITPSTPTAETAKEETTNNKVAQLQQLKWRNASREFHPPGVANGSSGGRTPRPQHHHYADPYSLAPSDFQQRINELNLLQLETIKYERYKRSKKKKTM